jgi:hypothetical protein
MIVLVILVKLRVCGTQWQIVTIGARVGCLARFFGAVCTITVCSGGSRQQVLTCMDGHPIKQVCQKGIGGAFWMSIHTISAIMIIIYIQKKKKKKNRRGE